MKITKPNKNIILIYLDNINEKKKAHDYLIKNGCIRTQYNEPFLMSAPEYLGELSPKQLRDQK